MEYKEWKREQFAALVLFRRSRGDASTKMPAQIIQKRETVTGP